MRNNLWVDNVRDEQSDGDEAGHRGHFPNPDAICCCSASFLSTRPTTPNNKMRQLRSKAYRKLMAMYSTSFGFRQPYQVLGAFGAAAAALSDLLCHPLLSSH